MKILRTFIAAAFLGFSWHAFLLSAELASLQAKTGSQAKTGLSRPMEAGEKVLQFKKFKRRPYHTKGDLFFLKPPARDMRVVLIEERPVENAYTPVSHVHGLSLLRAPPAASFKGLSS